ncbi:MAG: hypothetical protein HY589_05970, partial [Candidatus Omnitrophica bacterium]|nr:hypothetical protein [Candidatus Omnitrophota bacterium]
MGEIKFGTDGWRAIIGGDFTFANVKIVAQAIADYIENQKPKTSAKRSEASPKGENQKLRVVVGFDTRFMGREFADAVAGVLAGNGIKVFLSDGPTSTPALSLA